MPKNASVNAGGFRVYPWPGYDGRPGQDLEVMRRYHAEEPADLLSVTSIKTLAGVHWRLVNWQISNVVNLAMGVRKATVIGPRGGVSEKYVPDGEAPGEFVKRMLAVKDQKGRDELRSWLRSTAEEPRDVAAVRGSVVHKMIEMNLPMSVIDRDLIEKRMKAQWLEEKRKQKPAFIDDDFHFVENAMANYWAMRKRVPFVVLSQEPQVYNLRAGYAGSTDAIIWFLGDWVQVEGETRFIPLDLPEGHDVTLQKMADEKKITARIVRDIGGEVAVIDWKTSKGVYTGHVIQTEAYMMGDFIALDGIVDERLSDILALARRGAVIHIRPDKYAVDLFEFRKDIARAFLGSVAYARFLAFYDDPHDLFVHTIEGSAQGERSDYADEAE